MRYRAVKSGSGLGKNLANFRLDAGFRPIGMLTLNERSLVPGHLSSIDGARRAIAVPASSGGIWRSVRGWFAHPAALEQYSGLPGVRKGIRPRLLSARAASLISRKVWRCGGWLTPSKAREDTRTPKRWRGGRKPCPTLVARGVTRTTALLVRLGGRLHFFHERVVLGDDVVAVADAVVVLVHQIVALGGELLDGGVLLRDAHISLL